MAHAQKPDFVFPRNGRVHLNRWGLQFSRLLAPEVCASALVMLETPCSEAVWEYWLPTPFASFPFTSPPVRHRVPPGSERALLISVKRLSRLHFHRAAGKIKPANCATVYPMYRVCIRNIYRVYTYIFCRTCNSDFRKIRTAEPSSCLSISASEISVTVPG